METIDSVSLQRSLLDTGYVVKYAELNDSNLEHYIEEWHNASEAHQLGNTDKSLTLLYNKVINYYDREDISNSPVFYVIPENVRIHILQPRKRDEEWFLHIDTYSENIFYDVPVVDIGKPVLYLSDSDQSILSNYLSWIYEWRGNAYYEERHIERENLLNHYIPVRPGGDLPGYYRFYSAPIITDIYHYRKDILISVVISGFHREELLLKDGEEEFKVVSFVQV